ncbi:hypothetical protein [Amycolatopsis sp. CA-230715]|uniref:hypothetical protein n=1 Tax=Amycolatopsis sp. CA-230715 TaxID=2745196 RepID=UPI001C02A8CE|nr:hypothetical protein [Amycolatopsis sp. CA-230715]QWF85795.1 hypothetical protein HUW46_09275 [Amycolatopsis sp. CA-230715]
MFAHHGYPVDIKAISLYEHVPTNEDVLARIVHIGHNALLAAFERTITRCDPDPINQVGELVRTHVLVHVTYPLLAIVATNCTTSPPVRTSEALALREHTEQIALDGDSHGVEQ